MTRIPIRPLRALVAAGSALALAACSASDAIAPLVQPDPSAVAAADVFVRLSDSLARAGNADAASVYASLGTAVRTGGRVSRVTLSVDGVPSAWMASAQLAEVSPPTCAGLACPPARVQQLRSLIAWDAANPKRVVQLASAADSEPVQTALYPTFAPVLGASLLYVDGAGGTYFGTSGTQRFTVATSETPCPGSSDVVIAIYPAPPRCTTAEFVVQASGRVEPSTFLVRGNTGSGSHTIAMASQPVAGVRLQSTLCTTGCSLPLSPPIVPRPAEELTSTLTVQQDSVSTLVFTVRNASSSSADLLFSSGQTHDVEVRSAVSGAIVWRWSQDRAFTGALVRQSLASGATLAWRDAVRLPAGRYVATAYLTSTSHRAAATASFEVK